METIRENIEELIAFHMVATEKSFTKAAITIGVSKAHISKMVRRLELNTRSQLFHRTTRTLSLTISGEALLTYSSKIINLSSEASRRLKDLNQDATGVIKISAPISLGEIIFPEILVEARKKFALVKFELDLSNDNRDIQSDQIDFALRAYEVKHPDLIARPLGKIRDVICASPQYLRKNSLSKPEDLESQDCILDALDESWNSWTMVSTDHTKKINIKGHYSSNQYSMAKNLCIKGFGVARLPFYLVEENLKNKTLIPLFEDYKISTHPLYLVYLRSEFSTRKHTFIRDLLLRWFKEHEYLFVS